MKIKKVTTPNKYQGRNGWKPDMIVSHITEGSYTGAVSWLSNPASKASSHFVISKQGEITQLVDITDTAWTNGTSITEGRNTHYSKSSLKKVRDRKTNANYYTVTIEHEGRHHEANGALTPKQLEASIWLHKHIRAEVKRLYGNDIPIDREHIVGHYQINPITKPNCPGINFQFDKIIASLKGGAEVKPDINKVSNYAKKEWEWAKEKGYLDGTAPGGPLTREQAAVILYRLFHNDQASNWSREEIEKGIDIGITDGSNPGAVATREQVIAQIVRAIELEKPNQ